VIGEVKRRSCRANARQELSKLSKEKRASAYKLAPPDLNRASVDRNGRLDASPAKPTSWQLPGANVFLTKA
jgi:hypothetical protein